jgi:acyl carrier protein
MAFMAIRPAILATMAQVAQQQKKPLAPLTDDLPLLESGLDSLCIAVLVATLDDTLGIDPFAGDEEIAFPVTVGDFIRLYENAAAAV